MAVINNLIVEIVADPMRFIQGFNKADLTLDQKTKIMTARLREWERSTDRTFQNISRTLAIGAAAFTYYGRNVLTAADQLKALSDQTGISTEALSEYQFLVQQTTGDFEGFVASMRQMIRQVSDANAGVESAQKNFKALGLSYRELMELSPDQMFEQIATQIQQLSTHTDKVALATEIFGKSGAKLVPVMEGGADGIRRMREEAESLGITLRGDVAQEIDDFNDQISKMQSIMGAATRDALMPFVRGFNELATGAKNVRMELHQTRLDHWTNQLERARQSGNKEAMGIALDRIDAEVAALGELKGELKQEQDLRELQNKSLKEGTATREKSNKALEAEKQALKDAEAAARPYLHATEEIQDAVADIFFNGESAAEQFKSVVLGIFKEIAAAAIIRPVISPIVAGVASSIGGDLVGKAVAESLGISAKDILSLGGSGKGIMADLSGFLGVEAGTLSTLAKGLGAAGLGYAGGGILADLLGMNSTGGSIGGALGAGVGSFFGPLGSLAGGALGSLVGGMFGGGTPHPASTFGTTVGEGGSFSNTKFLSKHQSTEAAKKIAEQVEAMTTALVTAGIDLSGVRLHGGLDVGKGGGFLQIEGGKSFTFNPEDQEAFEAALQELGNELVALAGDSRDLQTVLSEAAAEEERRLEILSQQNRFLDQMLGTYEDAARAAEKLALDFRKMGQDLNKALYDLRISEGSALSPEAIYQLAAERFRSVRDKAVGGDTEAMTALPEAAREFAAISREFNASNADFKRDFAEVEAALIATSNVALSFEQQQISIAQQQLSMLDRIRAALEQKGDKLDLSTLLKKGESLDVLSRLNLTNNLPELLVRLKKQELGFDVSGDMLFRDFVKTNPSAGAAFNAWVASQGGITQAFAEGGYPRLGVPMLVGEKGPEVYMPTASGAVVPNNRLTVSKSDPAEMTETLARGFGQLTQLTAELVQAVRKQTDRFASLESRLLARGTA